MASKNPATAEEVLARVTARLVEQGGCLLWTGATDADGYGVARWNGKLWRVNRLHWLLVKGEKVPDDMVLAHDGPSGCHNRACVLPEHLQMVTQQESRRRARRRGYPPECTRTRTILGLRTTCLERRGAQALWCRRCVQVADAVLLVRR